MPKQVFRTAAVVLGTLAANAAVLTQVVPMSPRMQVIVGVVANAILAGLAHANLYRNPDATPATVAYRPEVSRVGSNRK